MKIASGCTSRSYDLQKGYPLKCAGRLDKNFWRGIIDLQDHLGGVVLGQAAYRPSSQGSKAANVKPRANTEGRARGRPGGKTQEPGKWKTGTREVAREPWGRPGPPRTPGRGVGPTSPHGVSRNHANFKKTSRVGVPGHRLRIHRRCQRISAFEAQFWV